MDKRLAKRHKRQVARAKMNVKTSEPDLRTPEQIKADREASRPDASSMAHKQNVGAAARSTRGGAATSTGSAAKTSV
jgi:hypothetical protein